MSICLLGFTDIVNSVVAFQAWVNMKPNLFSNSFISMRIPNMYLPMSSDLEEAHLIKGSKYWTTIYS